MHEMPNNFLMMKKKQSFVDKMQTVNLRVKNPNSLDKIQHYGNTAMASFQRRPFLFFLSQVLKILSAHFEL